MRNMSLRMSEVEDYVDVESSQLWLDSSDPVNKYPAKKHARRVAAKLGATKGLIYIPGQKTQLLEDSDQNIPFRQLRYFYYLSGVDVPDSFVTYDIAKDVLTLYITIVAPLQAIWFGPGLTIEQAESMYDVDLVKSSSEVNSDVAKWTSSEDGLVYVLHESQKFHLQLHLMPLVPVPVLLRLADSRLEFKSLQHAMDACRVIKDEHELKLLRKANDLAAAAHTEVLRNIRSFKNEREVQAVFEEVCTAHGVTSQSYNVIAGSGPNAAVLHYMKNNEPLGDRLMFLLDAGPDWHCYASDVTRTFPISGNWPNEECKKIYNLVDYMQNSAIKRLRPGIRMRDVTAMVVEIMVKELLHLGIFKDTHTVPEIIESGAARIFLPHGIGHHIGLEVHDVSPTPITGLVNGEPPQLPQQRPPRSAAVPPLHSMDAVLLEENMVITVEPGIYFSSIAFDRLIDDKVAEYIDLDVARKYLPVGGVRIEDDVLITRHGHEVITTAPKGEEALRIIRGEK